MRFRGKTRKGRNRIQEHGEAWEVVSTAFRVSLSPLEGLWMLVRSKKDGYLRWFRSNGDDDWERIW